VSRYYRYGDIVHYRWGGTDPKPHSVSMVIGHRRRDDMLIMLPLADTNYVLNLSGTATIVAKVGSAYESCTAACPHNPEHEGASS
jgi:hypothetical protein